ncbi:hypothetical protein [Gracilibacillus alcaliphilus]|uniref:hypothetical protein n=1 Tax=Gracilibacillus alcaliphilus TaxID=1401441 RepID=UPI001957896A|nr:hypothetical protein [Gracilibacillus alcaliphilus]MBM7678880.1 hypothetical protein [Gracilibacillus alcaliphilus]
MKYFLCLLLICLVFSFGIYLGSMERTAVPVEQVTIQESATGTVEAPQWTDREAIMEELELEEPREINEVEATFLHKAADGGAIVVKKISDQIMNATYAVVDAIF